MVWLKVGFAFRRIEVALNYLVDNLPQMSGLAAETERLDGLFTSAYQTSAWLCPSALLVIAHHLL